MIVRTWHEDAKDVRTDASHHLRDDLSVLTTVAAMQYQSQTHPYQLPRNTAALAAKPLADRLSGATITRAFAILLIAVGAFTAVQSVLPRS